MFLTCTSLLLFLVSLLLYFTTTYFLFSNGSLGNGYKLGFRTLSCFQRLGIDRGGQHCSEFIGGYPPKGVKRMWKLASSRRFTTIWKLVFGSTILIPLHPLELLQRWQPTPLVHQTLLTRTGGSFQSLSWAGNINSFINGFRGALSTLLLSFWFLVVLSPPIRPPSIPPLSLLLPFCSLTHNLQARSVDVVSLKSFDDAGRLLSRRGWEREGWVFRGCFWTSVWAVLMLMALLLIDWRGASEGRVSFFVRFLLRVLSHDGDGDDAICIADVWRLLGVGVQVGGWGVGVGGSGVDRKRRIWMAWLGFVFGMGLRGCFELGLALVW